MFCQSFYKCRVLFYSYADCRCAACHYAECRTGKPIVTEHCKMSTISGIQKLPFTERHQVIKILIIIKMFNCSKLPKTRHLWQLKITIFQHRCLIRTVPMELTLGNCDIDSFVITILYHKLRWTPELKRCVERENDAHA